MLQGALQLQTSQTRRRHIGRTQSRRNGSVRTLSSRPREEPQEGCGLGTLAATNLDSEHNEVAARRARMLGVGVATLTLRCLLEADCRLLAAARRSESVKRTNATCSGWASDRRSVVACNGRGGMVGMVRSARNYTPTNVTQIGRQRCTVSTGEFYS